MKYDTVVFIGRFQPPHLGHISVIRQALERGKKVIICLGSANRAPTPKDPFTLAEREDMVRRVFKEDSRRLHFVGIRDYPYDDRAWITEVQNKVYSIADHDEVVALIGHRKDETSFYLDYFPDWCGLTADCEHAINATTVRQEWFDKGNFVQYIHPAVGDVMIELRDHGARYPELRLEREYYKKYMAAFHGPYPPIHVTADSVVTQSNHILVVKRNNIPGRGLYALPGGFLQNGETFLNGAIRELKEETQILYPEHELRSAFRDAHVFDHPRRSLRGRVITIAHHFDLQGRTIPKVKGADDAAEAEWLPIGEIYRNEDRFFEDHVSIIAYFLEKSRRQ